MNFFSCNEDGHWRETSLYMLNKTLFEMSFSKKNFMACFSKKKTQKTVIKKMYLYFKENNIFLSFID